MGRMKVLCYHGSPGTCDDFNEVAKEVQDLDLLAVARKGYPPPKEIPHREGEAVSMKEPVILLGYSWGCVSAIMDAEKSVDEVQALVLISPFLGGGDLGAFKSFILSHPLLGKPLIALSGAKVVRKLLDKSSHPQKPPSSYEALAPALSSFQVLSRAGLEKSKGTLGLRLACEKIKKAEIPVLLIWGAQDGNEGSQNFAASIQELLSPRRSEKIEDGGHALLWTHPKEVGTTIDEFLSALDT